MSGAPPASLPRAAPALLLALLAAVSACGPRRGGSSGAALPPPQGDTFASTAHPDAPPIWKAGVRPPPQGSTTKLGTLGAATAAPEPPPVDPSGLSGLSLGGGEGPRDVGPVHVGGGPALPDGLLGASWERVVFPAAPLAEEDTGIAVNARYAVEWGGVPCEVDVQHRFAKDTAARADRYVQRYWIHPRRPITLAEAVAKLPPLGVLGRAPDDFGVSTPAAKPDPGGTVLLIMARTPSPVATALGYGYAVPKYGVIDYRLLYELLLDPATPPGPAALVTEISVDVSYPPADAPALRSWKDVLKPK